MTLDALISLLKYIRSTFFLFFFGWYKVHIYMVVSKRKEITSQSPAISYQWNLWWVPFSQFKMAWQLDCSTPMQCMFWLNWVWLQVLMQSINQTQYASSWFKMRSSDPSAPMHIYHLKLHWLQILTLCSELTVVAVAHLSCRKSFSSSGLFTVAK